MRFLNYSRLICRVHCQGIDLLAGVLLFVMPEVDAFAALLRLCDMYPLHFSAAGSGAHTLVSLTDQLLEICDPELRAHMLKVGSWRVHQSSTRAGLEDARVTASPQKNWMGAQCASRNGGGGRLPRGTPQ